MQPIESEVFVTSVGCAPSRMLKVNLPADDEMLVSIVHVHVVIQAQKKNTPIQTSLVTSFGRNSFSSDKPTWLDINSALKDPETVLSSIPEAHEGEDCNNDLIPLEAFLVGSPIETAINLYLDVQKEYETELVSRQVGSGV